MYPWARASTAVHMTFLQHMLPAEGLVNGMFFDRDSSNDYDFVGITWKSRVGLGRNASILQKGWYRTFKILEFL